MIMEMITFLLQIAATGAPYLAVYGGLLVLVVWATIKATSFWHKTRELHRDIPEIKKTLNNVHDAIKALNQVLLEKSVISQSCYSSENSPRVLNVLGKKLLTESKADEVIAFVGNDWMKQLEDKKIKSLLELERESLDLVMSKKNDGALIDVQNFVYEHPHFETNPLTYSDVLFAMSLKLRDMYMAKHPELKSDDKKDK
jgi:hypothetical protein